MERGRLWYSATTLLALQMLLVVTGGLVRVTGSGLGCPTWPKCTADSFIPDESSSKFHSAIEFGNRMLTFALFAAAISTLLFAWKRSELRKLAWWQFFGIIGQGILGGITVLTKLHPAPVAGHLLLSMLLIAGATTLQFKVMPFKEITDKAIGRILAIVGFLTLIAGTIVTGSGPHAGDWQARRFGFDIEKVARLHGIFVTITLIMALYVAIKLPRGAANWLLLVITGQGLIGLIQWWQGLPQVLVGFHLLGASLFWFAIWRTRLSFKLTR